MAAAATSIPLIAEETLVNAVVIFRHGARGPTRYAHALFTGAVSDQWQPSDIETLLPVGEQQSRTLGTYLGQRYAGMFKAEPKPTVVWRSSPIERVVDTGRELTVTFAAASGADVSDTPTPFCTPGEEDGTKHFRPWAYKSRYSRDINRLRTSDTLAAEGERRMSDITRLANATNASYDVDKPAITMFQAHYYWEMLECERFAGRSVLRDMLTADDVHVAEDMAHWVWNQRFFSACDEWRGILGGRLLCEMASRVTSTEPGLTLMGGHDYSLLCTLCGLGYREYPRPVMGYGAYIVLEAHKEGDGIVLRGFVNPDPFVAPDGSPADEVQHHQTYELQLPATTPEEFAVYAQGVLNTIEADA